MRNNKILYIKRFFRRHAGLSSISLPHGDSGCARKLAYQNDVRTSRGFTLIELLIYMGLLSIILVVLSQIFGLVLDAHLESQSTSSVHRDGRFILSKLSHDVHNAQSIVTPVNLGDQSTNLQLTIDGINYAYSVDNGNLEVDNGAEANNLNSGDTIVSGLTFTRIGNSVANAKNTVRISYTVTSKIQRPNGMETKDFQTTIGIR